MILGAVAVPVICLTTGVVVALLQSVPGIEEALRIVPIPDAADPSQPAAEAEPSVVTIMIARLVLFVVFTVMGWLMFLLVNGYTLFSRGQTIGKLVVGAKIVDSESNVPNLAKVAFLRYLLPTLLSQLIPLFGLIDTLLIFGQERRCVHDYMAGTYVVNI